MSITVPKTRVVPPSIEASENACFIQRLITSTCFLFRCDSDIASACESTLVDDFHKFFCRHTAVNDNEHGLARCTLQEFPHSALHHPRTAGLTVNVHVLRRT